MNICFLASAASIHTVRWVNALVERGHRVTLMTMHRMKLHRIDSRVKIHLLKVPPPFGYYINSLEVRSILTKIKPDVLHVHYASGYGTLSRLVNYEPTLLSVWGSEVYLFPYEKKRNKSIIQKNLQAATRLSSTSHAMKEQTELFIRSNSPISVVPFGIDLKKFKSSGRPSQDTITIGTVKSLEKVYGIDILIESVAKLVDYLNENEYPIANQIKLMIVGEGSELESLQQKAEALGIGDITEFVGLVPNHEVPHYLSQLDIYCAFSRSESFGVAVLEASACKVPVVVSNVGGLPEVVQDGQTGYIVNHEDREEVVTKLLDLVMDKEKRRTLGQNGRKFVSEHYDWEKNVSEMENLYLDLK